ncbi:unnamed protein product [Larinioides sclopetarius]|uniref:Uncharacterized protein n=1 Tax=Larinioides sclopetarius TaxID=280406 RepID=A0AAV2BXT5_9ARAC
MGTDQASSHSHGRKTL